MEIALLILGVLVTFAAYYADGRLGGLMDNWPAYQFLVWAVLIVTGLVSFMFHDQLEAMDEFSFVWLSAGIGSYLVFDGTIRQRASSLASFGVTLALFSAWWLWGNHDLPATTLGIVLIGASLISAINSAGSGTTRYGVVEYALLIFGSAQLLGSISDGEAGVAAVQLLLAFTVLLLLALAAAGRTKPLHWSSGPLGVLVLGVGAYILLRDRVTSDALFTLVAAPVLAALLIAWLLGEDGQPWRYGVGAMIWLGVATLAFGLHHGFGVALTGCIGLGAFALLGRLNALATLAPLAAVSVFRVFSEANPAVGRALDIGQHYAIVGLLLGIVLIVAAVEWATANRARHSIPLAIAAILAGALAAATILAAALTLDTTGTIGMLFGLGIAPLVVALGRRPSATAIAGSVGLLGLLLAAYPTIELYLGMERADKLRLFWIYCAVVAIGAVCIWALTRIKSRVAVEQ